DLVTLARNAPDVPIRTAAAFQQDASAGQDTKKVSKAPKASKAAKAPKTTKAANAATTKTKKTKKIKADKLAPDEDAADVSEQIDGVANPIAVPKPGPIRLDFKQHP